MKKKLVLPAIIILSAIMAPLAGCQSGVSAEEYNDIVSRLNDANQQIARLQSEKADLATAEDDLEDALATIADLQVQVSSMAGQNDLAGDTVVETVTNIIGYYHDTHVYSKADLFVCSDMASEVWSMLKAQGIEALIVVGNKDETIDDIILSDHAWLLAEVDNGEYLALETTAGHVVYKDDNIRYYQGWYFESPADMKSYNDLVEEYNVRVDIVNQLIAEDHQVVDEYNSTSSPSEAAKLLAVHETLGELILAQEADLYAVEDEIDSLATRFVA